jgi:hypothetical protein
MRACFLDALRVHAFDALLVPLRIFIMIPTTKGLLQTIFTQGGMSAINASKDVHAASSPRYGRSKPRLGC